VEFDSPTWRSPAFGGVIAPLNTIDIPRILLELGRSHPPGKSMSAMLACPASQAHTWLDSNGHLILVISQDGDIINLIPQFRNAAFAFERGRLSIFILLRIRHLAAASVVPRNQGANLFPGTMSAG
jgi:hypothetical protein